MTGQNLDRKQMLDKISGTRCPLCTKHNYSPIPCQSESFAFYNRLCHCCEECRCVSVNGTWYTSQKFYESQEEEGDVKDDSEYS